MRFDRWVILTGANFVFQLAPPVIENRLGFRRKSQVRDGPAFLGRNYSPQWGDKTAKTLCYLPKDLEGCVLGFGVRPPIDIDPRSWVVRIDEQLKSLEETISTTTTLER